MAAGPDGSERTPPRHGSGVQRAYVENVQLRTFTEPQQGATYDDLLAVAKATEELGYDAFFGSDHFTGMGGDGLPEPTDAWITVAGSARETSRIRLGTLVSAATLSARAVLDRGRPRRPDEWWPCRIGDRNRLARG